LSTRTTAAASLVLLPFAGVLFLMLLWAPVPDASFAAADPLIRLIDEGSGVWLVPFAALLAAGAWWRVDPHLEARRARWMGVAGALTAVAILAGVRFTFGRQLPSFIPPEETAPTAALSLAAGVVEEVIFRLALLPGLHALLALRLHPRLAAAGAIVVTALLFALSHELTDAPFVMDHFLARALVPGAAFSLAAYLLGPSVVVAGHAMVHVCLPLLYG
jgi:membrane protease YdiL (CAAX protease family)